MGHSQEPILTPVLDTGLRSAGLAIAGLFALYASVRCASQSLSPQIVPTSQPVHSQEMLLTATPLELQVEHENPQKHFLDWSTVEYIPEEQVNAELPDYIDPNNSGNRLFKVEDPEVYVAPNFQLEEFARTDGRIQPFMRLDRELVEGLQGLRDFLNKPVRVHGGYRTNSRERELSPNTPNSRHISGDAADISVQGVSPTTLARMVEDIFGKENGIGTYNRLGSVHVDVRGSKARWTK